MIYVFKVMRPFHPIFAIICHSLSPQSKENECIIFSIPKPPNSYIKSIALAVLTQLFKKINILFILQYYILTIIKILGPTFLVSLILSYLKIIKKRYPNNFLNDICHLASDILLITLLSDTQSALKDLSTYSKGNRRICETKWHISFNM